MLMALVYDLLSLIGLMLLVAWLERLFKVTK